VFQKPILCIAERLIWVLDLGGPDGAVESADPASRTIVYEIVGILVVVSPYILRVKFNHDSSALSSTRFRGD
tara:strand:+ start:247 stop:462 length:216 start_codon:yes stop_codon:yes gene_type:complete